MKRLVWMVLIAGILAQTMSTTGIYLHFQANRGYIATYHCENRTDPASGCKGKCYLKKELEKDAEKKEHSHHVMKYGADVVLFYQELQVLTLVVFPSTKKQVFYYQTGETQNNDHPIFHPPALLVFSPIILINQEKEVSTDKMYQS